MRDMQNKNIKWWVGITSCVMLFIVIGFFAYSKMAFIWKGVQIEANLERSSTSPLAHINGKAKHATLITLNGREIFIEKDGSFSEPIVLIPGFSVISINTKDKFGNNKEKKFELVYKEGAPAVAMNSK